MQRFRREWWWERITSSNRELCNEHSATQTLTMLLFFPANQKSEKTWRTEAARVRYWLKAKLTETGMGVGRGVDPPLDFEIWHFPKTVVFLVSRGTNKFYHFSPHPRKIFLATSGKIHCWPSPGKNASDAHGNRLNQVRLAEELQEQKKQQQFE